MRLNDHYGIVSGRDSSEHGLETVQFFGMVEVLEVSRQDYL